MSENKLRLTADDFRTLSAEEKSETVIEMQSKTFAQDAWNRFKANKLAMVGLVILVLSLIHI